MNEPRRYVAYYRVSTAMQGRSGLGLDAQRHTVSGHLASEGGMVVAEFVEVESGRRKDRVELSNAIRHARITKSSLIIAKLDRLARSVSFTSALMESGVEFVCCDMPQANKFTIHIMSALAEMESEMISSRTRAALVEAKKRGTRLGNPRLDEHRGDPRAASLARQRQAEQRCALYVGLVLEARQNGKTTLQGIADHLNNKGALTHAGNHWHAATVRRLLQRLKLHDHYLKP